MWVHTPKTPVPVETPKTTFNIDTEVMKSRSTLITLLMLVRCCSKVLRWSVDVICTDVVTDRACVVAVNYYMLEYLNVYARVESLWPTGKSLRFNYSSIH